MILTEQDVKSVLNKDKIYEGFLTTKKWSYFFFKENISPLGNIIGFESPVKIGVMHLTKAFVLAIELPYCGAFGLTCFNRLYCAQLGSLLSESIGKDCYVDGNCHIVDDKQISLSISSLQGDTGLINIVISQCNENLDVLQPAELTTDFKHKAIDSFYFLTQSIFIEARRDNL